MSDGHDTPEVKIARLEVGLQSIATWSVNHEVLCAGRWRTAIVLLITNLLALCAGLATLLYNAPHHG